MADKSVKVTLRADVANYVKGMRQAADATEQVERTADNADKWGGDWADAAQLVGGQMILMGSAAVAGVGLAVNQWAKFDEAMSSVEAATHASAAEIDMLTEAARDAGAGTAFSATEAANAVEELAKAGVSTADILAGGLDGSLSLAAAGSLQVGDAAEIAATALTQFKLSGEEIPHVADLLAAGAGKAQGEVQDLSEALNQGGLVASQMGLSIEETVGGLSAFASAGLLGSDAGTSFKTMLQRLANPMGKAQEQMDELGINAWDAQGNFVGLAEFAGQLETAMADLSPEARNAAMSVIFGSDAVRAANVLYDQGQDGIEGWIGAVDDAGYAAETAALKQDNLRGDLEKLGGAWDDLMIGMGQGANGPLRAATQGLTEFLDFLGSMPPWMQSTATGLAGIAGAGLLISGMALTVIPKIVETRAALDTLGVTGAGARDKLKGLFSLKNLAFTAGLVAAGVAVDQLMKAIEDGTPSAELLNNALSATNSAADTLTVALNRTGAAAWAFGDFENAQQYLDDFAGTLERISTGNFLDWLSVDQGEWAFSRSLQQVGEQLGQLAGTDLPSAQSAFSDLVEEYDLGAESQWQLLESMDAYKTKLTELATEHGVNLAAMSEQEQQAWYLEAAMGSTADSTGELTDDIALQEEAMEAAQAAVEELTDAIRAYDDLMAAMLNSEIGWYDSLSSLDEALAQNGATLDVTTEAGRNNKQALLELAQQTNDWAASTYEANQDVEETANILQQGRDQVIAYGEQLGMSREEAEAFADSLIMIPSEVESTVNANTAQAESDINYATRDRNVNVSLNLMDNVSSIMSAAVQPYLPRADGGLDVHRGGSLVQAFARGGFPTGIYPGGQPIYKFAEPETRWEAFISGRPGQEQRNIGIAFEALRRLGVGREYANGGIPTYRESPSYVVQSGGSNSTTWAPTINVAETDTAQEILAEMRREQRQQARRHS